MKRLTSRKYVPDICVVPFSNLIRRYYTHWNHYTFLESVTSQANTKWQFKTSKWLSLLVLKKLNTTIKLFIAPAKICHNAASFVSLRIMILRSSKILLFATKPTNQPTVFKLHATYRLKNIMIQAHLDIPISLTIPIRGHLLFVKMQLHLSSTLANPPKGKPPLKESLSWYWIIVFQTLE